ncbi:MAG: zinc-dependent dehydrogenase [bacterium]
MKAQVFYGPQDMRLEEVPTPTPKEGELLLKVESCAICGTDVRIYYSGHHNVKPPQIIGHEISAVVAEIGDGVEGYSVGDRVTVVTEVGCGKCKYCLSGRVNLCTNFRAIGYNFPGGYAEYMVLPQEAVRQGNAIKIPQGTDLDEVTLIEPLSCVLNGQEYLDIGFTDTVVVIGSGPIGCMHTAVARARGANKIILADIQAKRLEMAKPFGADLFVDSSQEDLVKIVKAETDGLGADVIIIAAPSGSAQEQAFQMIAKRGRISFFGGLPGDRPNITLNSNIVHYNEVSIYGAYASRHFQYYEAAKLLSSKRVDLGKLITHKLPLEDLVKGIELVRQGEALKVVVKP